MQTVYMLQIHTNDEAKRQWTHMHISFCSSFSYTRACKRVHTCEYIHTPFHAKNYR